MRRGFTLLTAIFLMVLIATLMVLAFSLSAQTKKQTGDIYLKQQALLLGRSATEFALLAISGHDRGTGCINQMNMQFPQNNPIFDVNLTLQYFGNGMPAGCNMVPGADTIATRESNGTVLIDTIVSYTDPATGEQVRFHRRTIQKP